MTRDEDVWIKIPFWSSRTGEAWSVRRALQEQDETNPEGERRWRRVFSAWTAKRDSTSTPHIGEGDASRAGIAISRPNEDGHHPLVEGANYASSAIGVQDAPPASSQLRVGRNMFPLALSSRGRAEQTRYPGCAELDQVDKERLGTLSVRRSTACMVKETAGDLRLAEIYVGGMVVRQQKALLRESRTGSVTSFFTITSLSLHPTQPDSTQAASANSAHPPHRPSFFGGAPLLPGFWLVASTPTWISHDTPQAARTPGAQAGTLTVPAMAEA
ncbi:hypothetical protein FB45DRAFT_1117921 [Roridomyces roridus]|uniref:Uncharacterized protein n=1 Tax=Roridomyces roridus TaxID=1738132 RepID=A0AAD7B6H0_9AGAR|nr:hypothetical protein FB45DRAFT_1117921 [Roridomyces roridus]